SWRPLGLSHPPRPASSWWGGILLTLETPKPAHGRASVRKSACELALDYELVQVVVVGVPGFDVLGGFRRNLEVAHRLLAPLRLFSRMLSLAGHRTPPVRLCFSTRRRPAVSSSWATLDTTGSAHATPLEVRLEEVLRAGRGHCGRGRDLQRERRGRDDLSEAVDLPWPGAIHEPEPGAGVREGRASADGADLEPGKPDRRVEPALDALSGPVVHRARADHAHVLAGRVEDRRDRGGRRERDRLHARGDRAVCPCP